MIFMIENTQNKNIKSIYLDSKTLEFLDRAADNLSISRSALIRILINQYCNDKQEDFKDTVKQIDLTLNRKCDANDSPTF